MSMLSGVEAEREATVSGQCGENVTAKRGARLMPDRPGLAAGEPEEGFKLCLL